MHLHCPKLIDRKTQMTSGLSATGDIRLRQKQLRKLEMKECKLRTIPDPSRRFESSHIVRVRGTAIAAQGGRSTEVARNRCAIAVGGQQVRVVAAAVGYAVSAAAKFITGTILPVDGGVAMR